MPPARILHLHSSFDLGGKEARSCQLINYFGDAASHVILSAVPDAMGARDAIDSDIDVAFPGDQAPALYGKPSPARYIQIARYMQKFDLILSYNWGSMDGVMARSMLAPFMKLPQLVHHEDGFNEDEFEKLNWKRNAFRRLALKGSHRLVVPSQTLKEIGSNVWKVPNSSLEHIPNGINLPAYQKTPSDDAFPTLNKKAGDVVVGTIAGLRAVKNIPKLVRAVAAAGDHVKLAIAGEGPEREAIARQAAELGISDRVIMPGFLKNPASYVGLFDIFALSSDSEQYPISLVEGMAAGCVVVSTNVGDVSNMVADPNRKFIIDRQDESAFIAALQNLSNDADLRRALGEANAAKAASQYGQEHMFAAYTALYQQAMGIYNPSITDFTGQA